MSSKSIHIFFSSYTVLKLVRRFLGLYSSSTSYRSCSRYFDAAYHALVLRVTLRITRGEGTDDGCATW